jgi:hypothetical protein
MYKTPLALGLCAVALAPAAAHAEDPPYTLIEQGHVVLQIGRTF